MDGLVAAAGIQQETPALEYTAKDANTMFEVSITGVFMTAQAVAKQMIKHGNGGSLVFIASMSASVANRVCADELSILKTSTNLHRVSSAQPTTPPKRVCFNSPAILLQNGVNSAYDATPSLQAILSQQWSRLFSRNSQSDGENGLLRIC